MLPSLNYSLSIWAFEGWRVLAPEFGRALTRWCSPRKKQVKKSKLLDELNEGPRPGEALTGFFRFFFHQRQMCNKHVIEKQFKPLKPILRSHPRGSLPSSPYNSALASIPYKSVNSLINSFNSLISDLKIYYWVLKAFYNWLAVLDLF